MEYRQFMNGTVSARVVGVVASTLRIDPADVTEELSAGDVPSWDSLGHVTLLQALEEAFGVTFDIDDALSIESVGDMVTVLTRVTAG
jgi:acyl carrier protein